MTVTLQQAIDSLYLKVVTEAKSQSPQRLSLLAQFCIEQLHARGLHGAKSEQPIPGAGRTKAWDVGWQYDGKYRLGISLKSILRNLQGTVPNRIDDLMGEAANVQLHSPEIVCGYVMLFNVAEDKASRKHGATWVEHLRKTLASLSNRKPPTWTIGTVEAALLVEVDFSSSSKLLRGEELVGSFFDVLVDQVKFRNPNAIPGLPSPNAGPQPVPSEADE